MSMLKNNEAALAQLSALTKEELEAKVGVKAAARSISAALYNSDLERKKDVLLTANPAGIIAGLGALMKLTGAKKAEIISPALGTAEEGEDGKITETIGEVGNALAKLAADAGISLKLTVDDFVTKTEHRDDMLVSLEDLAALADKIAGEEPKALFAVGDGELVEADPEMTVKAFLEAQGAWAEDIKAIETDHTFYPASALDALKLGAIGKELGGDSGSGVEAGSRSGVIRVLTSKDCILDQTRKQIVALRKKSCGKCTFCREGLYQLQTLADAIAAGRGKTQNFDMLGEISAAMLESCNCSIGDDAGKPVYTMLESFRDEAEAHVRRKECKAGACLAFLQIYVDPAKCQGAGECAKVCPAECIEIKPGFTALIESFDCTRCGKCLEVCPNGAIVKTAGKVPRNAEAAVKIKGAAVASAAGAADDDEDEGGSARAGAHGGAARRHRSFARRPGR